MANIIIYNYVRSYNLKGLLYLCDVKLYLYMHVYVYLGHRLKWLISSYMK